jgi:hypothetical protein
VGLEGVVLDFRDRDELASQDRPADHSPDVGAGDSSKHPWRRRMRADPPDTPGSRLEALLVPAKTTRPYRRSRHDRDSLVPDGGVR